MTTWRRIALALVCLPSMAGAAVHVVVVEGIGGNAFYNDAFSAQVAAIETASASVATSVRVFRATDASRDAVLAHFDELAATLDASDQLLVYLVGHGSYDDVEYKFNIAGPDLTDTDIVAALEKTGSTRQLFVNTSSASGALADRLNDDRRVVVLATRSGVERHATRFGSYFAEALSDPAADTNKDGAISAREAQAFAGRRVSDFFEREGRLETEHSLLEGTLADRFLVARLGAAEPGAGDDAGLADMLAERDAMNATIDALRLERDAMPEDEYRAELLERMLELARLEDEIEARQQELGRD